MILLCECIIMPAMQFEVDEALCSESVIMLTDAIDCNDPCILHIKLARVTSMVMSDVSLSVQ